MPKVLKYKNITVRPLSQKDIAQAKKLRNYINELVAEEAKILINTKKTLADEREWVRERLKKIRCRKAVCLLAEADNKIIGLISLTLERERQNHITTLSISIREAFRRMGLGSYLIEQVVGLAKTKLKPRPKVIQLKVFENNWPATNLYRKMGFKKIAFVPRQLQFKGRLLGEYVMSLQL